MSTLKKESVTAIELPVLTTKEEERLTKSCEEYLGIPLSKSEMRRIQVQRGPNLPLSTIVKSIISKEEE